MNKCLQNLLATYYDDMIFLWVLKELIFIPQTGIPRSSTKTHTKVRES